MALVFTKDDDSPLTGLSLVAERGIASAHIAVKILNNGTDDVVGSFVTLYAENSPGSGTYVSTGQPVVDERMGRFQITGQDSTATPGQEILLGVVQPMGHLAVALLPTIKPGDWILADFWIEQSGSSAGGGAINFKLEIAGDVTAYPLPFGVSQVGTGIDSGRKQPRSFFISGRATTPTGTPDDQVHVGSGTWLIQGEEYAHGSADDVTLNQNDSASAALAAGEAYYAVLTQGTATTPTVTKGVKAVAADAVKPTPPTGELILSWILVNYNGGGSAIDSGSIEDVRAFSRYKVAAPATGLSVDVYPGEAVIDSFRQVRNLPGTITLSPSTTSRIWLEWNGLVSANTSDIPPSAGAVKLAVVVTDSANVTSNTDTRTYIRPLDPGSLEVKETSGGVDVLGAVTVQFPDGSLTDLGSGVVAVDFPGVSGKADASLSVTGTEGVQRSSGTDLSAAVQFKLDVNGLTEDTSPDATADFIPTYDASGSVHKKIKVGAAGSMSLANYIVRETPSGTINGSNTVFTLAHVPAGAGQEMVFLNGIIQDGGLGMDYTISGDTITFANAPVSMDKIRVTYFKA